MSAADHLLDHLTEDEQAALPPEVYESLGRILTGAPPPPGSVTIAADNREDFRRQWYALFPPETENHGDAGAADHPPAPGPGADPGAAAG